MTTKLNEFMDEVRAKNTGEKEFIQAVEEVMTSIFPVVYKYHPEYVKNKIMERIIEPERIIMFRVPWLDDDGDIHINRGYRIEYSSAIGPYKGGLRFHKNVNLSILKFLGFEQIFSNSLTTLPMGAGKGGADFDPKGKSENEIMRFCQSFMCELYRHIGNDTDIPAGDIGVGGREIGYLFGMYKKLKNEFSGVLTGKGISWGGSLIRPEATGYGLAYFAANMMAVDGDAFDGKNVVISGSGNVAQYATEKITELGGKVVTLSDSSGFIYDPDGIDFDKWDYIMELKNVRRGRIREYAEKFKCEFFENGTIWQVPCDIAIPCATQNELTLKDAKSLISNGCKYIIEGANMPATPEAVHEFINNGIAFGPSKAANAGGVAVSGLEMSQNSLRLSWTREEVDKRLYRIMKDIHDTAFASAERYSSKGNYVDGANIAGFMKVADAMMAQGIV